MPDLLRRAIVTDQMRKGLLKLAIAADECIILGIADLGRVLCVIELVMMCDFLRKPHQLISGIDFGHLCRIKRHSWHSERLGLR